MFSDRNIKSIKKFLNAFIVILLIVLAFVLSAITNHEVFDLKISFLDVGQGDSTLIQTKNYQILIDTGANSKIFEEITHRMHPLDKKIEAIIITHPDKDHIGGLIHILDFYKTDMVFINKVNSKSEFYTNTLKTLEQKKIKVYELRDINDFILGEIKFNVIWPLENTDLSKIEEINNTSVSMIISYKDFDTVITGDLSSEFEEYLIEEVSKLDNIEIYKAGHHGSQTSSSLNFLEAANPTYSIISAGKNNSYGHPHLEVLNRLKSLEQEIYRTDLDGSIDFTFNNEEIKIERTSN